MRETEGHNAAAQTEYDTPMQHMRTIGGTELVKANKACVPEETNEKVRW